MNKFNKKKKEKKNETALLNFCLYKGKYKIVTARHLFFKLFLSHIYDINTITVLFHTLLLYI